MRRFWLLVLLVALLPLRGWAAAGMAVSAPLSSIHAQAEAAAMPCHGDASDSGSADEPAAPAHDASAGQASHLCVSCDLCHAALATVAAGSVTPGPLPGEGPLVSASRDTGRLLAGCLERPPRA
jgi:hypothetical protein